MSFSSALPFDLSPVRLSYVGALRGLKPKAPAESFTYAQIGAFEAETLICMAASNPQGQFVGVVPNALFEVNAQRLANERGISNVSFVATLGQIPATLDYLCADLTNALPSQSQCEELFTIAQTKLRAGGMLCYRYRAYDNADQTLQFLIGEYAPELSNQQAVEFLDEIKALGNSYFADHPIARAALDKAIEAKDPKIFFEACRAKDAVVSGAFNAMLGLLPRDFSFVGDAEIGANYIELAAPSASHATLDKCREHLLYEPIKDFALQRLIRNDVWVKRPVDQTFENPELYGNFTFGITTPRDRIPPLFTTQGGAIHLTTPLFLRLIDLMSSLPIGIGDFLNHPAGHGQNPDEVVAAINVLVACGIAHPMRSRFEGNKGGVTERPAWTTSYNAFLTETEIAEPIVRLASPIIGSSVTLSAREALVMQAIQKVGLANSAGSLQPTLKKLVLRNPALAAQVMEAAEPTDEVVHNILTSVLTHSMTRWYAYGLFAA